MTRTSSQGVGQGNGAQSWRLSIDRWTEVDIYFTGAKIPSIRLYQATGVDQNYGENHESRENNLHRRKDRAMAVTIVAVDFQDSHDNDKAIVTDLNSFHMEFSWL